MKTVQVSLSKLVPHEYAATTSRIDNLKKQEKLSPIIIKPIVGTDYFQIYQGHNRAKLAQLNGQTEISAIVAPPDFLTRNWRIQETKIRENPNFPLDLLTIAKNDAVRKDAFYRHASYFQNSPRLNTHRGTLLMLEISVRFDEEVVVYKCLPQKGNFGAILFNPNALGEMFDEDILSQDKIHACWGDERNHDASVLPAYVEIGTNTVDYRGGGFAHDVSFRLQEDEEFMSPKVSKRPHVISVVSTVIYPDGNMWRGAIGTEIEHIAGILWSDELANALRDEKKRNVFISKEWWNTPTSLVFGYRGDSFQTLAGCLHVHHSCGSTCHGGGCHV